MVNMEDYL